MVERSSRWSPPPCACPNCGAMALCVDWNEADLGGVRTTFEHQYDCQICGVFTYRSNGLCCWRDGIPEPVAAKWSHQLDIEIARIDELCK